jgi:hypothetical protein
MPLSICDVRFTPESRHPADGMSCRLKADVRLKVQHDLRNLARNGFPDGRDKAIKTASKRLHVLAETALHRFQPAKARRFEAFVTASETLGTNRTAWWRREDSNYVLSTQSYRTGLCETATSGLPQKQTCGGWVWTSAQCHQKPTSINMCYSCWVCSASFPP